jgi:hypothetical protein
VPPHAAAARSGLRSINSCKSITTALAADWLCRSPVSSSASRVSGSHILAQQQEVVLQVLNSSHACMSSAAESEEIARACQLLIVTCMPKSLRKAISKRSAKAPAIGGALTENYIQRTDKSNLHFTASTVKIGPDAICKRFK